MFDGSESVPWYQTWLVSIVTGLISSIVFEYLKRVLPYVNRRGGIDENASEEAPAMSWSIGRPDLNVYQRRRQRAKRLLTGVSLYAVHLLCVSVVTAIALTNLGKATYLDKARFIGKYLPHIMVPSLGATLWLGVITCLTAWAIALPVMFLCAYLGYFEYDLRVWILIGSSLLTYVLLGVHLGWVFYSDLSYGDAWGMVLGCSTCFSFVWVLSWLLAGKKRKTSE